MEEKLILIAEDDDVLRSAMQDFMQGNGYVFLETDNGTEAWRLFQENEPDVVVTDLRLPGIDGLELLEKIYVNAPHIPVIIVSGQGTVDDVVYALNKGAFEYIQKPIRDMTIILHAVRKALQHSYLVRKNLEYVENLERLINEKTAELQKQNQKLQEEIKERKRAERLIEHAKREWESTIDALPDMIALLDRDFRIIRLNKAMAKAMGMEPKDTIGHKCYQLLLGVDIPPEFCPHVKLLEDGNSYVTEIFEERLGGYFEISVAPYKDADGTVLGAVHVIRDINKRKAVEHEKERIQSQALHKQKLESVGQLAAGIAHEINTPTQYVGTNIDFIEEAFEDINGLVGQCIKLLDAAEDNTINSDLVEETREAFEDADWEYLQEEIPLAIEQSKDGIKRVTSIVRAMKDFSHPGSSEKEPADLNKIIETAATITRNEWKYVSDMKLDLDSSLPYVPCLSDEMGQVILNIIVNAAHAIEDKLGHNPEGEKGIITIKSYVEDKWAVISIGDTGSGIPEDARKKIFEPFYTTKGVGKGTGQGLAIARNVVEDKHHGSIDFETASGKGTTFTIKLSLE